MAELFQDSFVEATDTDLTSHTPATGTAWTLQSGNSTAMRIESDDNTLRANQNTRTLVTSDDLSSTEYYVESTLSSLTAQTNRYTVIRVQDDDNFIGWILAGTGAIGLRLVKVVAGVTTNLITMQGVGGVKYRIESEAGVLRFYGDGIQIGSDIAESTFDTETKQGLVTQASAFGTAWLDDYAAGTLGAAGITVTATLGTIDYTSQNTTVSLTGSVDVVTTLGTISYSSQNTTVSITGDIDVTATLGSINYSSQNTTVSVTGDVDIIATLGTINYSSNNSVVSLTSEVIINATLGTIDYTSQDASVVLSGLVDVTTTLGAIVYNSCPVTVQVGEGQVIGNVTVGFADSIYTAGFADDIYTAGFKPDTITVSFK